MLLARFVTAFVGRRAPSHVVDLGAGVGVIGLALALAWPRARVTLAELQPAVAELARRNVDENGLAGRVEVVEVDLGEARHARAALRGASADLVVSSPPYFTTAAGPAVPDEGEAIARHELRMGLADLAREARRVLVPGGRAAIVFPSERMVELLAATDGAGLRPARLRAIHPRPGAQAQRVLVGCVKGARAGLALDAPFILRDERGAYTDEAREALGEGPGGE